MNIFPVLTGTSRAELVGGAEVQQALVARALVGSGFRVSVLTADHGQPEVMDCDGVRIHRVRSPGSRGIKGLRFIHPHMTDVVKGLQRIDPDIVYFRTAGFRAVAVAWYARFGHKPFVYACASDLELMPNVKGRWTRRDASMFRLALRFADCVVVQNVRQRQLLRDHLRKDGVILPNCYSEAGAGVGSPDGHVLWVGTVKPLKSPEVFLELARRHPTRQFRMVGGAAHQEATGREYFQHIRDIAAPIPNLDFVGHVPLRDVGKHFDGASVLVNTSQNEGFPNTFLQAWIRGVPSLSFVNPEVIAGESGTIACADLEELTSRLEALTGKLWAEASAACKAHFARVHSVDVALQGYLELFTSLTSQRAGTV